MRIAMLIAAALVAACTSEPPPIETTSEAAVWTPQPIDPARCTDVEHEPVSRPPDNGVCHIELRLDWLQFATGQGVSEGRGEIGGIFTSEALDTGDMSTAVVPTQDFSVGQSEGLGSDLGTYDVPVGQHRDIEICAHVWEDDRNGTNGQDDFAERCTVIRLGCDPVTGQPTQNVPLGAPFCEADNTCNGSMAANVTVEAADADMDGVPNDDDFTPEPCDEVLKGTGGVGLLLYFHYDDNGLTTLGQSLWTSLSSVYSAYDYVVLVSDNATSNPNDLSGAGWGLADRVFPPTHQGLLDAMQDLTSKHYRFDTFVHAHGYKFGPGDSTFEDLDCNVDPVTGKCDPWRISGQWLQDATAPDAIGTALHGIPIIAYWSTTCISARQIDSWSWIGAKTASGAVDVQFFPNAWGNFASAWTTTNATYQSSVDGSLTNKVINNAASLVNTQGIAWGCSGVNSVILHNDCAFDFFNDTDDDTDGGGPDLDTDDAEYNISAVYDATLSGLDNMFRASRRNFVGNTAIRFGGVGLTWP